MKNKLQKTIKKQTLKLMIAGLLFFVLLNMADIFTPKPQSRATDNVLNGDLKDWETQQVVIKTAKNVDNMLYGAFALYFVWWTFSTTNMVDNEVKKQIQNKGE